MNCVFPFFGGLGASDLCYAAVGLFALAFFAAVAVYGLYRVYRFVSTGMDFGRYKTIGAMLFVVGVVASTISAQKTRIPGIQLNLTNLDSKGFDLSWDYGTNRVDTSRQIVFTLQPISSKTDGTKFFATSAANTNLHVNAVAFGMPEDWMRWSWVVSAEARAQDGVQTLRGGHLLIKTVQAMQVVKPGVGDVKETK